MTHPYSRMGRTNDMQACSLNSVKPATHLHIATQSKTVEPPGHFSFLFAAAGVYPHTQVDLERRAIQSICQHGGCRRMLSIYAECVCVCVRERERERENE